MTTPLLLPERELSPERETAPRENTLSSRDVYLDLFDGRLNDEKRNRAVQFLSTQLEEASFLPCDLPDSMNGLVAWMESSTQEVGRLYHEYLEGRKNGGPRRYFPSKSSALSFIKSVAPTKLVDGAWLYGLLSHWQDARFGALIQTYLEELGEGLPSKNHVGLYRKLLASQGLEHFENLPDDDFTQGAIQLSLAYNADHFLPEVIGFNLGYEQLPLHLLITAYELQELGVDPYYFTLHITVDNADSGHARKAVDAIFEAMPRVGNAEEWFQRVRNGYLLNELGASTNSVIRSFDLEQELVAIFERKGVVGQHAHSDYRLVGDHTVNEWLSDNSQSAQFLAQMEVEGWFKRHQDPRQSRFWKLIEGERAKMFGVFSPYERQVIYDWIAGDAVDSPELVKEARASGSFEAKQRLRAANVTPNEGQRGSDFDDEVEALHFRLASLQTQREEIDLLIELMSPALHHSAAGLVATRIFNDMLGY